MAPGGMESEWHEMVVGGINYGQKVVIIMKNSVTLTPLNQEPYPVINISDSSSKAGDQQQDQQPNQQNDTLLNSSSS
jgi:hypothetical protein